MNINRFHDGHRLPLISHLPPFLWRNYWRNRARHCYSCRTAASYKLAAPVVARNGLMKDITSLLLSCELTDQQFLDWAETGTAADGIILYFNTREINKENVGKKRGDWEETPANWCQMGHWSRDKTMAAAESLKTSNFLNIQKEESSLLMSEARVSLSKQSRQ